MAPWFVFFGFVSLGVAGHSWAYYVAGAFAFFCAMCEALSEAH